MAAASLPRDYKQRHDTLARVVHWELCKVHDLPYSGNWYEHSPARITENEEVKILWFFSIQTDREITHRRPEITVHDKNNNKVLIIDIAVPSDTNVESKGKEKQEKYQDLAREISRLCKTKTKVILVVLGGLGSE